MKDEYTFACYSKIWGIMGISVNNPFNPKLCMRRDL